MIEHYWAKEYMIVHCMIGNYKTGLAMIERPIRKEPMYEDVCSTVSEVPSSLQSPLVVLDGVKNLPLFVDC